MEELIQEVSCISCGCCLMDCESFAVNENFLGPHALAKAYRYAGDPREGVWKIEHRNGLADPTIQPGERLVLPAG